MPPDATRILLTTGKMVDERFDHPPLDALVPAMLISWKGSLQRQATGKHDVRVIDCIDTSRMALLHLWKQRQRGYRDTGYPVTEAGRDADAVLL